MTTRTALLSLTAALAFSASSALACPYMKQDQVTQAPMSPIASADSTSGSASTLQSSVATHDSKPAPATAQPAK